MRITLGKGMFVSEIANATGGRLIKNGSVKITHISTDSREVYKGDLFVPIRGEKYDGEDYVISALAKGAIVMSKEANIADILHPDGSAALLRLAGFYVKTLPFILYKIGITGSVGKTTTKEFLNVLLKGSFSLHCSEANYNNLIGMPMSALSAKEDTEILISEMGMNRSGEISQMSKCLFPSIAIITNIGSAHIGNLGSRESIAKAKLEIIEGNESARVIIPYGEKLLSEELRKSGQEFISFSTLDINANYFIKRAKDGHTIIYKNQSRLFESEFILPEEHNLKCLAAAVACAAEIGASTEELSEKIKEISYDNTRQNVIYREKRCFYTDYYNASFESVIAMIQSAKEQYPKRRKSLCLGDILELGDESGDIHFAVGKAISPTCFESIFLFGKEARYIMQGALSQGFPEEKIHLNQDISNPSITANAIRQHTKDDDMIFMKASRKIRLERVFELFKS